MCINFLEKEESHSIQRHLQIQAIKNQKKSRSKPHEDIPFEDPSVLDS